MNCYFNLMVRMEKTKVLIFEFSYTSLVIEN